MEVALFHADKRSDMLMLAVVNRFMCVSEHIMYNYLILFCTATLYIIMIIQLRPVNLECYLAL